jgi:glucosamine kinase
MLAICDGGSTKADWIIRLEDGKLVNLTTTGFNPNYNTREQIAAIVENELAGKFDAQLPGAIFYYGSGCSEAARKQVVSDALGKVFKQASIDINTDLLAAARATCGDKPGIACILGTGSNSVLYDGEKEIDQVTNLGFLLGDEGSGSQIGKKLVQAYFYREMPEALQPIMKQACPNGRKDIIGRVYRGDTVPAAYLASFVQLFSGYFDHPFVHNLIKDCFLEFLRRHVCKYENHKNLPVNSVGSVGYHCKSILQEAADELGLQLGNVLEKPALHLLKYHLRLELGIETGISK